MSAAVQIGPLLLSWALLLVIVTAMTTLAMGKWISHGSTEVERSLWHALLAGGLLARLAFVVEYQSLYLAAPWSIFDIRDGGWNPALGVLGAWMLAVYRGRQTPSLQRPLRWALGLGTTLFAAGIFVLSLLGSRGQPLPDLSFTSVEGRSVHLTSFQGRPTVINLWATWCPPCVREMPVLLAAQNEHPNVHFVFLNQGESPERVARWLERQGLPLRNVLIDPTRQASASFQQQGYPSTHFFDAEGRLVSSRIGELSAATLHDKMKDLITKPEAERSDSTTDTRPNP